MHAPARQPPDQEGIDRAGQKLAPARPGAGAGHVGEQPGDLGAGEVGIEQQARPAREQRLQPPLLQPLAQRRRAPDRLAGLPVPDDDRLALVGDAERGDGRGLDAGLADRRAHDADDARPDLLGVMLDPAGSREVLRELLLRHRHDPHRPVEDDRARRGRALVDGKHISAHAFPSTRAAPSRPPVPSSTAPPRGATDAISPPPCAALLLPRAGSRRARRPRPPSGRGRAWSAATICRRPSRPIRAALGG